MSESDAKFWATEQQLCQIFGWRARESFRKTWLPRLGEDAIRRGGKGKANHYDAAAVHRAVVSRTLELEIERIGGDPDLMGGGDSPNLERLRAAKADIAELDRDVRRRDLLPREAWEKSIEAVVGPVMRAAAKACPDCQRRFNEAVDRVKGEIARSKT